jgi:hypothetical protein
VIGHAVLNWQLDFQDARFRFRIGLQRSINSILCCIHDRLNMPGLRPPSGHGTSTESGIDVRFAPSAAVRRRSAFDRSCRASGLVVLQSHLVAAEKVIE